MTPPLGLGGTTECDRTDLLPPGYRVGGWVVTGLIGSGGWSTVYAARPAGTCSAGGRPVGARSIGTPAGTGPGPAEVALKIMPTAALAPRQARRIVESARREVELGRRLGHPRLIGFLDTFVLSAPDRPSLDGAIVLVMERAAASLREFVDAGVPEADRGRLIAEICEGLSHLHRSGWVHADLKPENVLLGADRSVKLSDFGLATELTGTHGYAPPMGTLDYLPPERWRAPLGELGVLVRPTADIWALGVVIHEVFTSGGSPFTGATPVARGAAVQEYGAGRAPLRLDHALPPFWRDLAADCLAPTHAARAPHTADSLLARIRAARQETPVTRTAPGAGRRHGGRARAAVLATALCGIAGAALCADGVRAAGSYAPPGRTGVATGAVRVFNAERGCQERAERDPQCSLGLAIDPRKPYAAQNVVATRVWHGDVLAAECELADGRPIIDEEDRQSTRWFRVRLPAGSAPSAAWLPAVRTKDRPSLPGCPHPAAAP
ncbi:serine/threonine-protein kinase [Streptomyces virginiae]|uniref:serine/threonine-protein kinase n=1 Tax=Streptomyces TaxID=1883 RepID=UPI0006AF12FB|nr:MULTISPECIES: serine/threonine-protein kinase [unclassified Streptomyces]KOU66353.1 serine/threonine protein kinase [Streptomyces sp. IGB124]KOU72217.1 serine/threonine protein kinase [Streptomyces sp. XY66]KOV21611.1 serine/threonine protein kinase [Streptomyces sp. XY413]KOV32048.1 serine/threonine protein kinase [Streptomyces sp. H021]